MRDSRPSHPPGDDGLRTVTERYSRINDAHAESVKGVPLPIGVAIAAADITDLQRAAVAREILNSGVSVREYLQAARARLEGK